MTVVIGVMARAPIPGRCKTRLATTLGSHPAAALYRAMLFDTLAAIEQACVDVRFVLLAAPEDDGVATLRALAPPGWGVAEQCGVGLGERLAHALVALGAEADVVALVASDSPTANWGAAGRALASMTDPRRTLMGPCADGGYWLIAQAAQAGRVDARIFDGIAWSTSHVGDQTRARCHALGFEVDELPAAYDVDDARDLDRLRVELKASPERAPRTAALVVQM